MASVLSHPAVPLALAVAAGPAAIPSGLAALACAASVLPDADAVGYWAGVPYGSVLGHRGFTHSLLFALLVAAVSTRLAARLGARAPTVFAVVFLATASHGILDALTNGGMGVAFFSPFSNARYFLPWRPIAVSPIGVAPFFSARGLAVLRSELVWIWTPCAAAAGLALFARRLRSA
ncbi:MAG TPA: metal-dependent hydrolase [Thermoanaerobaculia bacterium]|nr:metal-dependent hydrolase [Thermoanaerobaculia bacterium]